MLRPSHCDGPSSAPSPRCHCWELLGTPGISASMGSCTELMAPFLQIKVTARPLLAFPQQQDRSGQPARSGTKQQESSTGPRATR